MFAEIVLNASIFTFSTRFFPKNFFFKEILYFAMSQKRNLMLFFILSSSRMKKPLKEQFRCV